MTTLTQFLNEIEERLKASSETIPVLVAYRTDLERLLEIVRVQAEALEKVAKKQGMCIYNHSEEFMEGSAYSFNEAAEFANDARARVEAIAKGETDGE